MNTITQNNIIRDHPPLFNLAPAFYVCCTGVPASRCVGEMSVFGVRVRKFDEKGSMLVEVAFVAPIFFLITMSIIETSIFVLYKSSLRYIVFESTRDIQTGEIQRDPAPAVAFKQTYCSYTPGFMNCDNLQFNVTSFTTLGDVTIDPPRFSKDGVAENFGFSPGRQEQITVVTAVLPFQFKTPMLQKLLRPAGEPVLMVGYSIGKNEPFGCIDDC